MSILHSLSQRLSVAALACSILGAAFPSQAAVIAAFDPPFGPAYPTLGFRGTTTFDVTAGCYSLGSGIISTGGSCQITALSGEVDFYNVLAPATILNSVILTAADFASNYVFGAYIDPLTGQVTGFGTNNSNIFPVVVPSLFVNTSMVLYFQLPTATAGAPVPGVGGAFLRNCTSTVGGVCTSNAANTSNRALLTVTTVPEPDSIVLGLLGLGALVATRRRKAIPR